MYRALFFASLIWLTTVVIALAFLFARRRREARRNLQNWSSLTDEFTNGHQHGERRECDGEERRNHQQLWDQATQTHGDHVPDLSVR
jgi:hypothetical protein